MRLSLHVHGFAVVLLATLAGGCLAVAPGAAPQLAVATATFTPIPTFTAILSATPPPTVAATSTVAALTGTFYAEVSVDGANLRTQPGTVFPVRRLLAKGTQVQVLGHAPGGEWLFVQTNESVTGWLLNWLVAGGHDGGQTPLIQPDNVQVVQGRIVDRAGQPVSGIGFVVTQGSGSSAPRTDANSDVEGRFYAYLPRTASGPWRVAYVSVACTSNTMDANCNCIGKCGQPDPESATITLPFSGLLEFVWR